MLATLLSLMISQPASEGPKTAEEVIEAVLDAHQAHPYMEDIKLAPPVFIWPEGLPEPFQYSLEDGSQGTALPVPLDTAMQLYGLWCDYIPGEAQRRIDAGWAALDEFEQEMQGVLGHAPPDVVEGWATWEVFVLVAGAVVLAAGTSFAVGYGVGILND